MLGEGPLGGLSLSPLCQVWAYSTRYWEPDVIFQENVVRFPEDQLARIFCDPKEDVLKCVRTRETLPTELGEPRTYDMSVQVFSPTDLGIPSSRNRQYVCLPLRPFCMFDRAMTFESLFFRSRRIDASIYLKAVPENIRQAERCDAAQGGHGQQPRRSLAPADLVALGEEPGIVRGCRRLGGPGTVSPSAHVFVTVPQKLCFETGSRTYQRDSFGHLQV